MAKTYRLRNLKKSRARCLCGVRVSLHFTPDNRKLTCEEARDLHPRATIVPVAYVEMFNDLLVGYTGNDRKAVR